MPDRICKANDADKVLVLEKLVGLERVWVPGPVNAMFTALKDALRIMPWQEPSLERWSLCHPTHWLSNPGPDLCPNSPLFGNKGASLSPRTLPAVITLCSSVNGKETSICL